MINSDLKDCKLSRIGNFFKTMYFYENLRRFTKTPMDLACTPCLRVSLSALTLITSSLVQNFLGDSLCPDVSDFSLHFCRH